MIVSFKNLAPEHERLAGTKGSALAMLSRAGYRVPEGFIILPAAFSGDELEAEAWTGVQAHLDGLRRSNPRASFAVRSSSRVEDTARASFAGQFETVLDVQTDPDIRAAIHTVRRSRHNQRVQTYSRGQELQERAPEMAIIVQRLVRADFSGVLFTADPVTGDLMQMKGNYVPGLGNRLVSGEVDPSYFSLARPGGRYDGPTELRPVARELFRTASRLEKKMQSPQDLEWAVTGRRLYLLQSRPISSLCGYRPDTAEWNDSLRGNFLWSGTNLAEGAPQVITPFTCSLRKAVDREGVDLGDGSSLGLDGYPLAGIIGGRAYINLSVQVSALRPLFGGDSRRALQQVTAWWGEVPEDLEIPLIPVSRYECWTRVVPSLTRVGRLMARLRQQIPQFVASNPELCDEMVQSIQRVDEATGLVALWRERIDPHNRRSFMLGNAGAAGVPNRLEKELTKMVGAQDARALLSYLSGLSSPLESLGPLVGLARLARGETSRARYLRAYGHRGENEGECAWPRPAEDPGWLDATLAEYARAPVDVETLLARQEKAFQEAWERFRQRYPGRARSMHRRLQKAARAAQQREAVRSEAVRSVGVVRAFALRAGELTGVGEDVFFLTIDEVLALLAGDDASLALIPVRKETYERYRSLPRYPNIIVGRFDPFQWAADPNRRGDIFDANAPRAPAATAAGDAIRGVPGAVGVVEGPVRLLDSLEDSGELQPGEILVTSTVNIGWTLLFPRAAAIVTDLGAPLSHAAIVARELGIPAVVGCGDATMRLRTGDRVRVDGAEGEVTKLT